MLSNVTILVTTRHLELGRQQLNSFTLTERGILLVRLTEVGWSGVWHRQVAVGFHLK